MKPSNQPVNFDPATSLIVALTELPVEEKMRIIRRGLPLSDLLKVQAEIDVELELLLKILAIDGETKNLVGNRRLSFNSSDRLLALADLYYMGYQLTGKPAVFNAWMKRKFVDGDNDIPIETCCMVVAMKELGRLLTRHVVDRTLLRNDDLLGGKGQFN